MHRKELQIMHNIRKLRQERLYGLDSHKRKINKQQINNYYEYI